MMKGIVILRNHRTMRLVTCVALSAALLMVSGCEDEESIGPVASAPKAGKKNVEEGKAKKAQRKAIPEVTEEERLEYSYNPIGKRDPFRSFIQSTVVQQDLEVETPLQKYEIDQYQLVAIIWGMDEPVAMVEDPEGMGHFLKRDTLIGRNWGKVVRITSSEVVVAEEYRDFEGKLIVNEIPLLLPEDDEADR